MFHGQTKRQAGPHRACFSANTESVNNWIEIIHVHAKLKESFHEKIKISTNIAHKEITEGAKKMHDDHVKALVTKLREYGHHPFTGVARDVTAGKEINTEVIKDILKQINKTGKKHFQSFVNERLKKWYNRFFQSDKKVQAEHWF